MKLFKKLVSIVTSFVLSMFCMVCFTANADDDPSIIASLSYDYSVNKTKVTIIFDGFPRLANGGFHVELGDGLTAAYDPDSTPEEQYVYVDYNDTSSTISKVGWGMFTDTNNGHTVFIAFASSVNKNLNGNFVSFYVDEASNATPQNSTVNIGFYNSAYADDYLADINVAFYYNASNLDLPIMQKATKYKLGDTDGDNDVDSTDSYNINYALAYCPYPYYYSIPAIENTYTLYFPYAKDSFALDPNRDNKVSSADSTAINQYISAGSNYSGDIGKIFYHCYY